MNSKKRFERLENKTDGLAHGIGVNATKVMSLENRVNALVKDMRNELTKFLEAK